MQPDFKRFATTLSALLAASVTASAQDISTSLPLTSVGDRLMWTVGDQDLILDVPLAGKVRLELYSPRLDPGDYRADTYYGDEQYGAGQVNTTFSVLREDGSTLLQRTFTPGQHDWSTLLDQDLPAGRYHLRAATTGNGKNTFAIRLAGVSAEVHAEQLSVNVHSREWVAAVNVTTDGRAHTLRLYDGDGPQELQARLRDAQGNLYPLQVSADLSTTDLPLPATPGNYTVELRQPATARQFSNTVGFSLIRDGVPTPLTVARVDQTGTLAVRAELVLPGETRPSRAQVTVGAAPLTVDGQLEQRVPAGTYPVTAAPVPGAQVGVSGPATVVRGGRADVLVQVRPSVDLTLSADKLEVCQGDTVTLRAQASTAFTGDLPLDLTLDAPGLGETPVRTGTLNAAAPADLTFTATPQQPGPLTVTARLTPWGLERQVQLTVLPERTALQLQRNMPAAASVGDEVTVTLRLTNTGSDAQDYVLNEQLPAGLQALDPISFSGTLAPGESRALTYRAAAQEPGELTAAAQLRSGSCQATQTSEGTLSVQRAGQNPDPSPGAAPQALRSSSVSLPFDAPSQASQIVVAHAIPEGAQYVPGSARLNGAALTDPQVGPSGTLYWTLPGPAQQGAAVRGTVSYDLSHSGPLPELPAPALLARFRGDRSEVLQGRLDSADLQAARAPGSAQATLTENPGAIKFPLQDSLIRIRDRISVTVEVPLDGPVPLLVNGQPVGEDLIGETTTDPGLGVRRLTFVGVQLQPGLNTIRLGDDTVTVQRVGATARIEVTPVNLTADGATPLRLKVRTLDARGNLTSQDSVTLRSNLDPARTGGAATGTYTLPLVNGEGELILQPQSTPTTLNLQILQGQDVHTYTFDVTPSAARVGVGLLSATLGLDGHLDSSDVAWSARASYEGPLAGGKLYVAADRAGLPTAPDTLRRFTTLGDASQQSAPLQGLDPVAARYDHPSFRAEYRRSNLPIDVLPVGEQLTALTVTSKSNPQVSGFVALVPEDRVTDTLTPERTRLLRLSRSDIAPGSETLVLTTLERDTGKVLRQVTLQRNADYILDQRTGIVTLARALDPQDLDGNDLRVQATYRINDPLNQRKLAYGAQVKYQTERLSIGAAAISLDGTVTTGARASYANGATRADGLLAYSGGFQASGDFSTRVGRSAIQARIRYQDGQYHGLAPLTPGLNVSASVSTQHTSSLSSNVQAEYHSTLGAAPTQGGSVTARADYRAAPFSVGGGLKYAYGDQHGLGAVLSAGYHQAPLDVDVTHTQPLSGTAGGNLDPITTVSTRYAVTDAVTLGLTDEVNWKTGQRATLSLDTRVGSANYQVAYDLPTASGQGNRARFGVTTSVPLSRELTAGVRASATYDIRASTPEFGAGLDLSYKTRTVSATTGTDLTYSNRGFGVVLRGGISGNLTEHLTLTGDGLVEFGAGKNGQRAALGFAYRNRTFNALGSVRYVNGTLAGTQPELSSNFAAEYRQPTWAVRAALDTRTLLNDPGSFTAQSALSGTYYVTDRIGLGAWGRVLTQPGSQTTETGYGLEASYRALPGTWVTVGYNPQGFVGLGGPDTRQGAYVRLDLTLDDSVGRP